MFLKRFNLILLFSVFLLCLVLPLAAQAESEKQNSKKQNCPNSKIINNTIFNIAFTPAYGGKIELFRLRWEHLQMSMGIFHLTAFNDLFNEGRGISSGFGLIGIGAKTHIGKYYSNEIGFFCYPLSAGFWTGFNYKALDDDDLPSLFAGEIAIYYRYNFTFGGNLEAGAMYPIIAAWKDIPVPVIYIGFGY